MVVRIRFAMHGNRHDKLFHIVAINSKARRNARPIETLGVYRHTIDNSQDHAAKSVQWSVERIKYWLGVGAQPSKSVVTLCTKGGILPPDSKYHPRSSASRAASKLSREESDVGSPQTTNVS